MRRKNKILRIGVVFVCVGLLFSGIAIVKEIMNQQVNSFEDEMVVKIEENLAENGTLEKDIHVDIEGKGLGMIIGRHGDVLDSNVYQHDVMHIINGYHPKKMRLK